MVFFLLQILHIKSGLYLNCAVFGSLLIPLKPQRRKRQPECVALLEQNAVLTIDDIELKEKRVQPDKEQVIFFKNC